MTVWLLLTVLVTSCAAVGRRVVDLTHVYDERVPKYPLGNFGVENFTYYKMTNLFSDYSSNDSDTWITIRRMEIYEHQGTHIDAPLHFTNGGQDLTQIPPERLYGPGVVIDVRDKAAANPDYAVTVQDILDYEKEFGRIPVGAIVMMNSGWQFKYPDARRVFGSDNIQDPTSFHFPGFDIKACNMLLTERQVHVIGVDTPSTDPANLPVYYCHKLLQPNNMPLLEYVANLDAIPKTGTTIILGAPKIRNGTGGHTRILAFLPDDGEDVTGGARRLASSIIVASMSAVIVFSFC
ncbi:ISAHY-like protein [Mya arenaria]|uniref:ISAHY-like protein n=2 Tax=Mya arenaria TaxID=6604 RepID=A0ABY7DG45_MYAAR|nr:ISAHY-like protein [Mya arenaria]